MLQKLNLLSLPPEIRRLIWEAVALFSSQTVNATIRSCRQILHEFLPIIFFLRIGKYAGGRSTNDLVIAIEPTCVPGEWLRFYCLPGLGHKIFGKRVRWEDEPRRRSEGQPCLQVAYDDRAGRRAFRASLIGLAVADMDDPIIDIILSLPNLTNVTVIFEHPQSSPSNIQIHEAFLCQWAKAQDVIRFLKKLPYIRKFRLYLSRARIADAEKAPKLDTYWQSRINLNEDPRTALDSESVACRLVLPFVWLKAHYSMTNWDSGKGDCMYDRWNLESSINRVPRAHPVRDHCLCEGTCTAVLLHRVADLMQRRKETDFSQPRTYGLDPKFDTKSFWRDLTYDIEARVKSMDCLIDKCPEPQADMLRLHRLCTRYTSGRNFFSVDSYRWKSLQKYTLTDSFIKTRANTSRTLAHLLNPLASLETQALRSEVSWLDEFVKDSAKNMAPVKTFRWRTEGRWSKKAWIQNYPEGITVGITTKTLTFLPSSTAGGHDHLLISFAESEDDMESEPSQSP